MFDSFKEDIKSFMEHDPAARSPIEIVLLYPGFKALQSHKRAKWFLNHNMPFIARYISQLSKFTPVLQLAEEFALITVTVLLSAKQLKLAMTL